MFKFGVIGALGATGALAGTVRIGDREIETLPMACDSGLPASGRRQKCVDAGGNFLGCRDKGYHCIKKNIKNAFAGCYDSVPDSWTSSATWNQELSRVVVCDEQSTSGGAVPVVEAPAEDVVPATAPVTPSPPPPVAAQVASPSEAPTAIIGGREMTLLGMPCDPELPTAAKHQRCVTADGDFLGCGEGTHCFKKNIKYSYAACFETLPARTGWGTLLGRVVVCDDDLRLLGSTGSVATAVEPVVPPVQPPVVPAPVEEQPTPAEEVPAPVEEQPAPAEEVPVPKEEPAEEEQEEQTADDEEQDTEAAEQDEEETADDDEDDTDEELVPVPATTVSEKVHLDPGEGNRCLESEILDDAGDPKCQCAGPLWRCADTKDRVAKACDEGFQCVRKNAFYGICAKLGDARYQELAESCEWDLTVMPCGERTDKYRTDLLLPRGECPLPERIAPRIA